MIFEGFSNISCTYCAIAVRFLFPSTKFVKICNINVHGYHRYRLKLKEMCSIICNAL